MTLHSGGAWAIESSSLARVKSRIGILANRDLAVMARVMEGRAKERSSVAVNDGVACIPILGVMMPSVPWYYAAVGVNATNTTKTIAAVNEAAEDGKIKGIFLYVDSPGGRVDGTEQLAEAVHRANGMKRVVAGVNNMCCSAAYWVASQASLITANPGATVGSIGCILAYEDWSRCYQNEGVDVRIFSSGPKKGAGYHSGAPLTEPGAAELQKMIDDHGAMFAKAVGRGRGRDASSWATGETWRAADSMNLGLIDRLAYATQTLRVFTESLKN